MRSDHDELATAAGGPPLAGDPSARAPRHCGVGGRASRESFPPEHPLPDLLELGQVVDWEARLSHRSLATIRAHPQPSKPPRCMLPRTSRAVVARCTLHVSSSSAALRVVFGRLCKRATRHPNDVVALLSDAAQQAQITFNRTPADRQLSGDAADAVALPERRDRSIAARSSRTASVRVMRRPRFRRRHTVAGERPTRRPISR